MYANFEQLRDLNLQPKIIRRLSELNDAFDIIYLSAGSDKINITVQTQFFILVSECARNDFCSGIKVYFQKYFTCIFSYISQYIRT